MKITKKVAVAAVVGACVSVQGGASIAKMLLPLIGPGGAVLLRIGFAGLILSLFHRPPWRSFTKAQWGCILFYAFSIAAMNASFYCGVGRVPLGVAVTIEFTGPLVLALVRSRSVKDILWALLAALGIGLIVPWHKGFGEGAVDPIGVGFVALAGLMWAFYIVATDRIAGRVKNADAICSGMLFAALFVLPFGIFSGVFTQLTPHVLWLGLGIAVFSSALPFTLDLLSLNSLPGKTFGVLQSLQPAIAALSGFCFLGEKLTWTQWFAILCIMASSTGATLTTKTKN